MTDKEELISSLLGVALIIIFLWLIATLIATLKVGLNGIAVAILTSCSL